MIRHIVLFKLKEYPTLSEKQKAAETLKSELLEMKTKIPVIREFKIGSISIREHPPMMW